MRTLVIATAMLLASNANAMTPPSITQAVPVSGTEIDISWVAAIPDSGTTISEYRVLRNGTIIATVNASTLTYNDIGLTPGTTYTYAIRALETVRAQSAAVAATTQSAPPPPPSTAPPILQTATRPSYNTGNGFFVVGRGIYDANGNLFTPIGANLEYNNAEEPTRFMSKLNVERFSSGSGTQDWVTVMKPFMDNEIANKVVPIVTEFFLSDGSVTSGDGNLATLNSAVNIWVSQASKWTQYNNVALFNIANEWGPCNDDANATDYVNGYLSAIPAMRSSGYTAPLVIDSGCSGQGPQQFISYAQQLENADPLHNVVFSIHVYNAFYWQTPACNSCGYQFTPTMQQLAALNVPVIIGEFGPTNAVSVQPSPVTPDQVMQAGETYQFGWLAWSWDDGGCVYNMLGPCPNNTGVFDWADMTPYGKDVILSPGFGMQATARPATIFP